MSVLARPKVLKTDDLVGAEFRHGIGSDYCFIVLGFHHFTLPPPFGLEISHSYSLATRRPCARKIPSKARKLNLPSQAIQRHLALR